jgi:GNAT superfamily N-acetyltransferase
MNDFLTDLSNAALAHAVTENCYAFSPYSHGWKGVELHAGKDVNWVITNIPFPPTNCAFHTNIKPEDVDSTIEKFKSRGIAKNMPLSWYIGPETRPLNFTESLTAHGFTSRGDGAGMAIDLQAMNETEPLPTGLEIIEVKDNKTLKLWCHVVFVGFGMPAFAEPYLVKLFQTDLKYKQPLKFFLGMLEGKPIATSNYFLGKGVVGIYFVATLPEARNKGIGFAITQAALKAGQALGYRVGILQASEMGQPVYTRMGFKEVCRVSSYMWLPDSMKEKEKGG